MNTEMNAKDITSDLEKSFRAEKASSAYGQFINEVTRLVTHFDQQHAQLPEPVLRGEYRPLRSPEDSIFEQVL